MLIYEQQVFLSYLYINIHLNKLINPYASNLESNMT